MAKMRMGVAGVAMLAGVVVGSATRTVGAQAKVDAYTVAAPLSDYFMEKAAEMEMARSAAPVSISGGAEVLVMGKDGYSTAVKGVNGFTCLVERGFAAATDDPVFWNPKVRGPVCLNAAAARTYLPLTLMKAKLALAGKSRTEIGRAVKLAVAKKELPVMEAGAMSYMMSKEQYLGDAPKHWHPHMMWFVAGDAEQLWGGNLPGSPAMAANDAEAGMTTFFVVVDKWSDGAAAMEMDMK